MESLRRIIGKEQALDQFHLIVRRAAGQVADVSSYGACLVTCADERLGVTRSGFDRAVATPLISDAANARDRVFSVSNMAGRLEPGAFSLIDDHFTRADSRGSKLLIFEIASHVGRIKKGTEFEYGHVDRYGRTSTCCGALTVLLDAPSTTDTVRHPWFEQLNAFFGPVRLAALRAITDSTRMVAAAIVHAAMQAESAVSEVFQNPPAKATHVLLIGGVAVNQQWADGFLPVSYHHLRARRGRVEILSGYSLRTTPESLRIDVSRARIEVEGGREMETAPRVQRHVAEAVPEPAAAEAIEVLSQLEPHHRDELDKRLDAVRSQVESVRHDPEAWRTYARPILRGLFRGLSVVQPELGVGALLYEGGEKLFSRHKLKQIVDRGPSSVEGRRVLHDVEAELQQLNHEDAQQVLDILLSKKS
jgi:hypothetical protein